jgi:hypothetical protein
MRLTFSISLKLLSTKDKSLDEGPTSLLPTGIREAAVGALFLTISVRERVLKCVRASEMRASI